MRRSSFTKWLSSNSAWLGLVLILLVGMLGVIPTPSALANAGNAGNFGGQVIDGDQDSDNPLSTGMSTSAAAPLGTAVMVNAVSAGLYHTCAVRRDGHLICWGYDRDGQVSGPNGSSDTFIQVSGGGYHTCGLKTDGTLACWGYDRDGQVSGPNGSSDTFTQVSGGLYHTCGLKTDGTLACWGYDEYGQVRGPNNSSDTFAQVSGGRYHTCGVKEDGHLACWGPDWYGQVSGPNGSSDTFTQASGGGYHTCGVKRDGRLACWGHDWYGQVSSPNRSSDTYTQVSGGGYFTCAVRRDGHLACWGQDRDGQVSGPNGSSDTFTQVSGGLYHTCGLKTDGTLVCWGNNDYGQVPSFNQSPTDMTLSNGSIDENQPINTEVGTFTTTDPDVGDTHTYTLVSTGPCPGPDNGSFNINADGLRTSAVFDYETKNSYTICIRTDDGNGGVYDEQFIISVNNVNEAPVNTVPGAQSTNTNTALTFSASDGNLVSVNDVDADGNPVQVTLTSSNGTLTLDGTSGLVFSVGDGTANASMVFTGAIASINTALDGMSFNPTPSYYGMANVRIITDDRGNSGSGGSLADDDTVDISVEPITVNSGSRVFLPLILVGASAYVPDLVVDDLVATSNGVTVTIRNMGMGAVTDAFWVDVYFNPTETPGVNKPWDTIASHGIVWGVTTSIPAGGSLVLTADVNDPYYFPEYSSPPPMPVGATVYALVDSINYSTTCGAVQESNEGNNLSRPVTSIASMRGGASLVGKQSQSALGEGLPSRR